MVWNRIYLSRIPSLSILHFIPFQAKKVLRQTKDAEEIEYLFQKKFSKPNVFWHYIVSTTHYEKIDFLFREFGIANKFFNFLSLRYDNDMALSNDFKEIYYDELLKVWEASFLLLLQSVISFWQSCWANTSRECYGFSCRCRLNITRLDLHGALLVGQLTFTHHYRQA